MTTASVPFRHSAVSASVAAAMAGLTSLVAPCAVRAQVTVAAPDVAASAPVAAASAPVASPPDTPDSSKVQSVTVTADRRAESIKRVPASVTAVTGTQLESLGAARIDDFIALIPGMGMVGGRPGNRLITLRGITSGGDQQNATVGTYIDDVPVGSSTTFGQGSRVKPDVDVFDLDRLEVLRGPQGTLYGANSLGGLLKYVTLQPDPTAFSAFGRAEVMSVAHGGTGYGANAGFNTPLGDHESALRVSTFTRDEPGYIDNVAPGGKKDTNELHSTGGRIAYAITPITGFHIRAAAMTQTFKTDGEPTEDVSLTTGQPTVGEYEQARYTSEASKQNFNLYSLSMDLDVAGGMLLSVTSYNDIRYDRGSDYTNYYHVSRDLYTNVPLIFNETHFNTNKTTQEFRYTSAKSDQFEWITGLFYTKEDSGLHTNIGGLTTLDTPAPAPNNVILTEDTLSTYQQSAAYANARYYFTPKADIGFGLRYTHDDTDANDTTNGTHLIANQSSNFTSFMLAPRYLLSPDTTLYARVASASRPGGPNFLTAAGVTGGAQSSFTPDKLISYETGVKTTAFDGKLSADLSAFYIDWKQIQLRTSTNGFFYIGNGGTAKSEGIDLSVQGRPIEPLTIGLNVSYLDAELTQDAPVAGGHSGDRLPNTSKYSGSLTADYETQAFANASVYAGASWRYVGDRLSNFTPAPRLNLPAYTSIDVRTGIRWPTWDLNFYVKNLADTHYVETITTNFYPVAAAIGRPRTIGIFATLRY